MAFIRKLKKIYVIFFLGVITSSQCLAINYGQGVSIETLIESSINKYNNIKWITIEDIQKSLPERPINVGFSLDDTLFFSRACYYGVIKALIKEKRLQHSTMEEVINVANNDPKYWDKIAICTTKYAIPKQSVMNLIKMHQQRGDNIFFITYRKVPSVQATIDILNYSIKETIATYGGSGGMLFPVQYSNMNSKISLMKKNKLSIFYGSQDNDIKDAQAAKVRSIRIMSSSVHFLPQPLNGQFGEEVLVNSFN